MQPDESTSGDGVYMASGLSTSYWMTNKGAPPWEKVILLLPPFTTCLQFFVSGWDPTKVATYTLMYLLMLALFC